MRLAIRDDPLGKLRADARQSLEVPGTALVDMNGACGPDLVPSGRKPLGVPFGGYKDSGFGREGSIDELLSYTRKKSIVMHYGSE